MRYGMQTSVETYGVVVEAERVVRCTTAGISSGWRARGERSNVTEASEDASWRQEKREENLHNLGDTEESERYTE